MLVLCKVFKYKDKDYMIKLNQILCSICMQLFTCICMMKQLADAQHSCLCTVLMLPGCLTMQIIATGDMMILHCSSRTPPWYSDSSCYEKILVNNGGLFVKLTNHLHMVEFNRMRVL